MKISVIIPVYNAEKYLRECLESFVNQTYKDFEIICVDDGSTDNSLDILNEYSNKYDYIKIVSQKNQGAGIARNNGLKYSQGEYVYFFDADDFVKLNLLDEIQKDIIKFDYPDILRCRMQSVIGGINEPIKFKEVIDFGFNEYDKNINFFDNTQECLKLTVGPTVCFLKKSFIKENNLLYCDLRTNEDLYFFIESMYCAKSVVVVNKILVYRRLDVSSSLINNFDKYFMNLIKVYKYLETFLSDKDEKLRIEILRWHLYSFVYWYLKYINHSIYNKEIHIMTQKFLREINFRNIVEKNKYMLFYIMGYANFLICKTLPFIQKLVGIYKNFLLNFNYKGN